MAICNQQFCSHHPPICKTYRGQVLFKQKIIRHYSKANHGQSYGHSHEVAQIGIIFLQIFFPKILALLVPGNVLCLFLMQMFCCLSSWVEQIGIGCVPRLFQIKILPLGRYLLLLHYAFSAILHAICLHVQCHAHHHNHHYQQNVAIFAEKWLLFCFCVNVLTCNCRKIYTPRKYNVNVLIVIFVGPSR